MDGEPCSANKETDGHMWRRCSYQMSGESIVYLVDFSSSFDLFGISFIRSSQGHGVHLSSLIVLHYDAKPFWERFHSFVVEMHPFRGEGGAACFLLSHVSTSILDSIRRTSSKPIMCPSTMSMYLGDLSSQSKQLQQWMLLYSQRPCLLV